MRSSNRPRTALFFQDGNFVGREYFSRLVSAGLVPDRLVAVGAMSEESAAIERERTGGRWSPPPIPPTMHVDRFSRLDDPVIVDLIVEQAIDVAIQAGVGLIRQPLLSAPAFGFVNVHPGALPAFRGSACPEWAILEGAPVVLSAHLIDEGLDTGPLLLARAMPIVPSWDYFDFRSQIYSACADVLIAVLRRLESAERTRWCTLASPQPTDGACTRTRMSKADTGRARMAFQGWSTRIAGMAAEVREGGTA